MYLDLIDICTGKQDTNTEDEHDVSALLGLEPMAVALQVLQFELQECNNAMSLTALIVF